jgi:cation diffusion facilitator family transporter
MTDPVRITVISIVLNIFLGVFKIVVGVLGGSGALIADGIHSFSDFVSDIVVLIGIKLSDKPVDDSHNYGHGKFETFSTVILGAILFIAGVTIFWKASLKIYGSFHGEVLLQPGTLAIVVAALSIIVKEILFRYTKHVGEKTGRQSLIANAWHHRSDALSSIAAFIGIGGAIILGKSWRVLDPFAAIVVSFFILKVAGVILKESLNELLEASLGSEESEKIVEMIKAVPGVKNPHNLRTRKVGNAVAIELHLWVDPALNVVEAHDISTDVEKVLKDHLGANTFISVHIEPEQINKDKNTIETTRELSKK